MRWAVTIFMLTGCAATPPSSSDLTLLYGTPIKIEQTSVTLGTCCDGCLCHGTDVYRLTIRQTKHLFGRRVQQTFETQALSGFFHFLHNNESLEKHLFIIRHVPSPKFGLPAATVVEADPRTNGSYCTWHPLTSYLDGSAPFLSYEAMDRFRDSSSRNPHCYSESQIRQILNAA